MKKNFNLLFPRHSAKRIISLFLSAVMLFGLNAGSMSAMAVVTKEEAMNPKALTYGTAAVFEKKDGNIQDVYYFTTAASTDSNIKTVDYNFTFSSEAHLKDKTTSNERDDTVAVVAIYKYNDTTKEADTTPALELAYDATSTNRYVASEKFLFDKDDKIVNQVGMTYGYEDTSAVKVALPEKTTYFAKVEQFGTYQAKVVKNNYETLETRYTKASLTVTPFAESNAEWITTVDTADPGYTQVNEAASSFNGAYYGTRYYGGAVEATYQGSASDIVVPDTIDGKRVTVVNGVSENVPHSRITSLTLGENVRAVKGFGDKTKPFTNLEILNLNEGLEKIESNAFSYCVGLKDKLVIPESVNSIGAYAFYNTGYSRAEILGSNTAIGGMAIGYEEVFNLETINPYDTIDAPKEDFYIIAPIGALAYDYGEAYEIPVFDSEHIHVFSEPTVIKQASCTEKGIIEYTCTICGYSYREETQTGHNIVIDPAVEATCKNVGLTEGSHCSVCGEIIVPQQEIPKTHKYFKTLVAPTCTSAGYRLYTCEECGESYINYFPKLSHDFGDGEKYCILGCGTENPEYFCVHNWIMESKTEADCVHSGKVFYECSYCHDKRMEIIPIQEHTFVAEKHDATPNSQGYTKYVCPVCNYTYVGDITDFASDSSALSAAITEAHYYSNSKFSAGDIQSIIDEAESYRALSETNAPQSEYDYAVGEILTAIQSVDSLAMNEATAINGDTVITVDPEGVETPVSFAENINEYNAPLDVVKDGIVNAKDFAWLLRQGK